MPTCASCQRDNESWRRYCGGCGLALQGGCRSCGVINDPADRYCGGCSAPLMQGIPQAIGVIEPIEDARTSPPAPPPPARRRTGMAHHTVPIETITDAILSEALVPVVAEAPAPGAPGKSGHKQKRKSRR